MTTLNWSLLTALRESGGHLARAGVKKVLGRSNLDGQIEAYGRRGYRLEKTSRGALELVGWPNRLFSEEITHGLGTDTIGRKVEMHWTVESTNDFARAEALKGREGKVIFAEEQTRGRGRFGRKWNAPRYSSLLMSVALHSGAAEVTPEELALGGAVAVAEALHDSYSLGAHIRWPNDVLVDGLKVSGVLVESIGGDRDGRWFVAGTGINVDLDADALPAEVAATATSISALIGRRADRALVARAVLRRLDFWWDVLKAGDRERLSAAWRKMSDILGRFVTVKSRGKTTTGRVVDLDQHYGLVLQLSGGPTKVFAPAETTIVK